jgi:hypothetical protein
MYLESAAPARHANAPVGAFARAHTQAITTPGDIVVILHQEDHALFRREGPHLFLKKKISLSEALTEFRFVIRHLDNRHVCPRGLPLLSLTILADVSSCSRTAGGA